MSFLNPVNEPVLRFKSTDAGAPQINYNSRVAGDVKAVIKACLVTGYGAKASAGWSIVNEVNHVAEFVSPAAAMSGYRLGVDDTSAASTTWYYQHQDARVNPAYNMPTKAFTFADKTHASNGWQLFITPRGLVFVEIMMHTGVNKLSTRITYWGQVKSGSIDKTGANICFFNIGHSSAQVDRIYFYNNKYTHIAIASHIGPNFFSASPLSSKNVNQNSIYGVADFDLVSPVYIMTGDEGAVLGSLPCFIVRTVALSSSLYEYGDTQTGGRLALDVTAGYATNNSLFALSRAMPVFVYTDYWEY